MTKARITIFVEELCMELGLNTAHDYDGVETLRDLQIYKKAIIDKIRQMKGLTTPQETQKKYNKLWEHIGSQQVDDIHATDQEIGENPSMGDKLVRLLIENAQNQTGILLNEIEKKDFKAKVIRIYG